MDAYREFGGFGSAVSQSERGEHISLSGCAATGAATLKGLVAYLLPQIQFCAFHLCGFRIGFDLFDDGVDFFHLEIDYIIHYALGFAHVIGKKSEIELSLGGERILYIAVEIYGHETAAVVRAEGYLSTGIGGYCLES